MAETVEEKNKIDLVNYLLKIAPSISVFDMVQAKLDRYGKFTEGSILSKMIFSSDEKKEKDTLIYRGMFRSNIELKFLNATIVKKISFYNGSEEYTKVNDYFYYLVYVDPSDLGANTNITVQPDDNSNTKVDILGVAF